MRHSFLEFHPILIRGLAGLVRKFSHDIMQDEVREVFIS